MATLKTIKTRIVSVKNTKKVTKAMQMIAAARLRKAQMAAVGARAYANHVKALATRIAHHAAVGIDPLLQQREKVSRLEFIVITSDRGLCGGFNGNLIRDVERQWDEYRSHGVDVSCVVIGRKGRDTLKARGRPVREAQVGFCENLAMEKIRAFVEPIVQRYVDGAVDRIELVYNRFRNVMAQDVTCETMLPLTLDTVATNDVDYLYEPSRNAVVHGLLRQALIARVQQACLESVAGEFAARMTAMDSATKNANDMIDALTMQYNRARQASITKELLDIVNGSESIKQ